MKNKIFLFPLALAVIFFASFIIIFSPAGKKNIIAFPTPTITPTPTPSTIIWQTYINLLDNYQISYPSNWISYPSNWKVTKEAERIILEKPDYTSISTYISIDSSNERGITLPIKTWINKSNNKLLNDPNRYIMSSPDTILSSDNILNIGITAVIIGNGFFGSGGKTYIFPYNNKIFEISTSYPIDRDNLSDTDIQKNISEIDQILSTFKFLPDTSTWKTYKNTEHGFEFKYPHNWYIFNREDSSVLSISNKPIDNNTKIEEPFPGQIFINFYFFHSAFENGLGVTEFELDNGVPMISDTKYIAESNSFGMAVVYRKLDDANTINTAHSTADQILSTFKFIK